MELDDLSLEWSSVSSDLQNEVKDFQILEMLKPHQRLKRLTINCYGGVEFPAWISDPSFSNLEFLELHNCQKCTSLPSLGQLPTLKEVIIRRSMDAIKFGDGDNFSSGDCFPSLEKLVLKDCPMLVGKLPLQLPSLKMLEISRCPQLIYSQVSLPLLEKLVLRDCSEAFLRSMVDLTALTNLSIGKISNLAFLPRTLFQSMTTLEALKIETCKKLNCLSLEGANIANVARLKRLSIISCPLLASLTGELNGLQELRIRSCPKLFLSGKLPTTLKILDIHCCQNLEPLLERLMDDNISNSMLHLEELSLSKLATRNSIPSGLFPLDHMPSLSSLSCLRLDEVEGLEWFPEGGLCMPSLKGLYIDNCKNLKSLPSRMHDLTCLQSLGMSRCQRVKFIPEGGLPLNLTYLYIDCENLRQPMTEWGLHRLTSLKRFEIGWICPPDDLLPISLTFLRIDHLKDLKYLSRELFLNLSSLERLFIHNCPKLKFLPMEGLPSSLGHLWINNCPRLGQRLQQKGEHQHLKARIPLVQID